MHFPPKYDDAKNRGKTLLRSILVRRNEEILKENQVMRTVNAARKRKGSVARDSILTDDPTNMNMNVAQSLKFIKERPVYAPAQKPLDILTICVQLDSTFGDTLEQKFGSLKREAFETFKILQNFERRVITSEQALLLRTLRLSHERYLDKFKDSSSVHFKPRTLLQIVKDKDQHFDPEFDLRPGFEGKYFNKFMQKKRLTNLVAHDVIKYV